MTEEVEKKTTTRAAKPKVPAIYAKYAKIQAQVGAIPKNGKGPSQKGGFAYIKYEDILDKIHSLLVEEDVIVIPNITYRDHQVLTVGTRQNLYATVEATYTFIATEDGSSLQASSVGEGSAIGDDTATRKASTMAQKIAFLNAFTIPNTELGVFDDDEGTGPVAKPEPPALARAQKTAEVGTLSSGKIEPPKIDAKALEMARTRLKETFPENLQEGLRQGDAFWQEKNPDDWKQWKNYPAAINGFIDSLGLAE